jgi:xanthine/uracil permease
MRKKLLVGSLLAAILIFMVPMVSAVEWKTVQTELSTITIQDTSLQVILKNNDKDPQPTCIILFLTALILFLKFVRFIHQNFKLSQILIGLIVLFIMTHFYG